MEYYAKLIYKGNIVGYRYEHKGKVYDIEAHRKELLKIEEINDRELTLIPHGKYLVAQEDIDNNNFSIDLTENTDGFFKLLEEDKVSANVEVHKESKSVENKDNSQNETVSRKVYKLDVRPTKKKVQTFKGVGILILGVDLSSFEGVCSKRYLINITVTSKTAITNVSKILGAKFNEKNRLRDFEKKGVTEFKLEVSDILLNDVVNAFGVVPCMSQKNGLVLRYTCLDKDSDKETVKSKMRLTDFMLIKKSDDIELVGLDMTMSDFRDLIFNYCNTGKYIVLSDI